MEGGGWTIKNANYARIVINFLLPWHGLLLNRTRQKKKKACLVGN